MARKKKRILLFFQLVIICALYNLPAHSQPILFDKKYADSILPLLSRLQADSVKVNYLATLSQMFYNQNGDSTIAFAIEGAALAKKIGYTKGLISCLQQQAFYYGVTADWPKATVAINELSQLLEKYDKSALIFVYNMNWLVSVTKSDTLEALKWALKALHHPEFQNLEEIGTWATYMHLARAYETLDQLDSAEYYAAYLKAFIPKYGELIPDLKYVSLEVLGDIAYKRDDFEGAITYFHLGKSSVGLARTYHHLKQSDSAIYYALLNIKNANKFQAPGFILEAAKILEMEFSEKDPVTALKYLRLTMDVKDKLYNTEKVKQMEAVTLNQQQLEFDRQAAETSQRNRLFRTIFILVLSFLSLFLFVLWRNNSAKRIANIKLEQSFSELKATQAQLIQSEKMASLGELTAGVAHEIQNPLNFVNNFSDLNQELILELKDEISRGNMQEVEKIADDIRENEGKINHHGKRADAIVKNMLQHSRSSNGQMEPTDINALCDEYLRLSYHGLRAKDKNYNATLETDYGLTVGKLKVIPQDIGRVLLNLFNNAFYAVAEKKKTAGSDYQPTVSISTLLVGNKVQIIVKDNGSGIPEKLQEKIFQPFFTTKPTGLGTGLGLSLSYDIIKAHGGEILVKSTQGEGTVFTIYLPDGNKI